MSVRVSDRRLNPSSVQARTARSLGLAVAFVALGCAGAGVARAAATNTVAFRSPGRHSFIVPAGVRSLTVIAVGAAGGNCRVDMGGAGGVGAALTAVVPVKPNETLFVGVGTSGADCGQPAGGVGGSGGGAAGGSGDFAGGAGGGGATVVGVPSPSPALGPQLLVVAGAGGGAAEDANGGGAGSAGENPGGGGGGGGPGALTAGGTGGTGRFGGNGASGSFGMGGAGGGGFGCEQNHLPGAGGGGGGYFGGGGGGCGAPSGGGGGGSSFVVSGGATLLGPTPTASPSAASITYPAPSSAMSTDSINFASQTPGTFSPEKVLTVTNKGSAPLVVTGVRVGGSNPDEFLVSPRCQLPVPVGSSCEVAVRFDPQAAGERSATLRLVTNTSRAPTTVSLSGTGAGTSVGGPSHDVELVNCVPKSRKTRHAHRKAGAKSEVCTGRLVHGELDFTTARDWTRATVERRRVVYATGASMPTAHGGFELVLNARRILTPGNYVLMLRIRRDPRWVTRRLPLLLRRR